MRKVLGKGVLQMSLFAEKVAEVEDQGHRYVLPENEPEKILKTLQVHLPGQKCDFPP
jgi:hypothetical protein